ncbi:MAG: hypothetical protein JJU11_09945, partial [Candidatus Sumerlaeia bacterium]|nr:hypothetical protein [Candidatus Sumerlaeia bacterium]
AHGEVPLVGWGLSPLTTPVSYLTDLPGTTFASGGSVGGGAFTYPDGARNSGSTYETDHTRIGAAGFPGGAHSIQGWSSSKVWRLRDAGPIGFYNNDSFPILPYDPTNGTVSDGDIFRYGP